jgi:para-nitrobenzyl esterase
LRVRLAAATLFLAVSALPVAAQEGPVVTVLGGEVRGAKQDSALVFRGIPYAAPPLGELRWKPPQPAPAWDAVRDVGDRAPACPQVSEGWNEVEAARWSEDCLTLDIRTPALEGKLPVMVWIHGGSNRAGSSSGPADSDMSAQGVVHVGIQYRLGLLGFLSHPELSAEGGGASGNYALMDQVAALEWVRENIERFGGDPANVTIYGESAGSQDVSLLLAAPSAQGLFHKAILQSGTPGFGLPYRSLPEAEALGDALGPVEDLRGLPVEELLEAQAGFGDPASHGPAMAFLRTTVDGKVLPQAPDRLISGHEPKPVIVGTDKVEFGSEAESPAEMEALARAWFGERGTEALAAYRAEEADPRRGPMGTRLVSDAVFHCPADRLADLLAENGWPVWRYEFDVGEDGGLTRHAYEIGFIFERKPVGGGTQMQDYWAALAIAGDPNADTALGGERPHWQRWSQGEPRQMAFGEDISAMEPGAPRAELCEFAENY